MKKYLFYLITFLFLISCDASIARNQFEKGEYLQSVKTTVKYVGKGKFAKLKEKEKAEILSRVKFIDDFYRTNIENENNANNNASNKILYDAFHIQYLLKDIPELRSELIFLTQQKAENLLEKLVENQRNMLDTFDSRSSFEIISILKSYRATKNLMDELKLHTTKYEGYYKVYVKNIADGYLALSKKYDFMDEKYLDALREASTVFSFYDKDYKGSRTRYEQVKKAIEVRKADEAFEIGKKELFFENYDIAIEKLSYSYEIYNKYSINKAYEVRRYLDKAKEKQKEQKAEEFYTQALRDVTRNDYKNAVKNFYAASKIIYNYKDSYTLAKKYEQYIKGGHNKEDDINIFITDKSFKVISNSRRENFVVNILENMGFQYDTMKPKYVLYLDESTEYNKSISTKKEQKYVDDWYGRHFYEKITDTIKETVTVTITLTHGRYSKSEKVVLSNEYIITYLRGDVPEFEKQMVSTSTSRELGKSRIMQEQGHKIESAIESLVRDFARSVR